ncbi:MAG: DUF3368 domain-containing protein [Burkholderiales bacterium]
MAEEEPRERRVLSDASPLIGLAAAGGFDLLRELFGAVWVTAGVRDEVLAGTGRPGAVELKSALDAGWIHVLEQVPGGPPFPALGEGEVSTLHAALAAGRDALVILDDERARQVAEALEIEHVGALGVIVAAKRRGLITAAAPYFARLADHGFHLPKALVSALLRDLGETRSRA